MASVEVLCTAFKGDLIRRNGGTANHAGDDDAGDDGAGDDGAGDDVVGPTARCTRKDIQRLTLVVWIEQ